MPDARSETLRKGPLDSWLALSPDQTTVVAVGNSHEEVAAALDRRGDTDAIIPKTHRLGYPWPCDESIGINSNTAQNGEIATVTCLRSSPSRSSSSRHR